VYSNSVSLYLDSIRFKPLSVQVTPTDFKLTFSRNSSKMYKMENINSLPSVLVVSRLNDFEFAM